MTLEPNDLLLFARIVEAGSLSLAAERSGQPRSTVSRRLSLLESALGERLLQRTTRKLVLTEFGASVLEHARRVAEEVEAAGALFEHRQGAPTGTLRVSMPSDMANLGMNKVLTTYLERYPGVTLELDLSPRRVDLVAEKFDLAIRMGALQDDASLAARRVVFETMALYAAPGYVARRGLPAHPDDLLGHDLLCLPRRAGATNWHLTRGKVSWERELSPRVSANSPELLLQVARAGVGIAGTSNVYAAAYVARGDLVRVLPEWDLPSVTGWAVFPGRRLMPAKTRAFLDLLEELCCEDGRAAP